MSDSASKQQSKPQLKRIDAPPKPPTKTTLDLQDESGEPPHDDNPLIEMMTALTNAQTTWCELLILNGGGRRLKREWLELSLDRNVILLGKLVPKMQDEYLEMMRRTLQNIRDYRLQHPRDDASNLEQAKQAQKVLDEMR